VTVIEFNSSELSEAVERFYPNWWIHETSASNVSDRPQYRVVVRSDRERELALACKPHYIDVRWAFLEEADTPPSSFT
jgi:hypothetical protein